MQSVAKIDDVVVTSVNATCTVQTEQAAAGKAPGKLRLV